MSERNRIWFDTEFIENGETIDLISIGMVNERGNTLYLENTDCRLHHANDWVKQNVIPHLKHVVDGAIGYAFNRTTEPNGFQHVFGSSSRKFIAKHILDFAGAKPEFWAYYSAYDWVVLCQLFGRMVDLPPHFPMWCRDLKQYAQEVRLPKQETQKHNALEDALWTRDATLYVDKIRIEQSDQILKAIHG